MTLTEEISLTKALRADLDDSIQSINCLPATPEVQQAVVRAKEAVMWLGMHLKGIGERNPGTLANPYPNSKDPSSPVIDRTADGLKL